jgi:hypothetical protein
MTTPAELVDHLNGTAARAGFAAFAAGCAARLAPVFESFARAGRGRYAEWLAQLQTCTDAADLTRWVEQFDAARGPVGHQALGGARASAVHQRLREVTGEIALAHDWDLAAWAALGEGGQPCR